VEQNFAGDVMRDMVGVFAKFSQTMKKIIEQDQGG